MGDPKGVSTGVENESFLDAELDVATNAFLEQEPKKDDHRRKVVSDFKSIPGWDKNFELVVALMEVSSPISDENATKLVALYNELSPFDKKHLKYGRTIKTTSGSFARSKNQSGHVGEDATRRCFISAGTPSLPPSKSRVVEALCAWLLISFPSPVRDPYMSRYGQVLKLYNSIQYHVNQCAKLIEETAIVLFQINEYSLSLWYGHV